MNLVKSTDVISTQALWVELTDLDGELVYGGGGKPPKKGGYKKEYCCGGKTDTDIDAYYSNVVVSGRDTEFEDNAF
jgi:hypothetical protein